MQPSFTYTPLVIDALEKGLSADRFSSYVQLAQGDREKGVRLYLLNTALSEALYSPAQALEVLLRNRMHDVLSKAYGSHWYTVTAVGLNSKHQANISELTDKLTNERKPVTLGRIVCGLSFGFWTSLYAKSYNNLWMNHFHALFKSPTGGLRRSTVQDNLLAVKNLRNRVAHHEPVLHLDLVGKYEAIFKAIGWMCPETEKWARAHSRFAQIWQSEENPYFTPNLPA